MKGLPAYLGLIALAVSIHSCTNNRSHTEDPIARAFSINCTELPIDTTRASRNYDTIAKLLKLLPLSKNQFRIWIEGQKNLVIIGEKDKDSVLLTTKHFIPDQAYYLNSHRILLIDTFFTEKQDKYSNQKIESILLKTYRPFMQIDGYDQCFDGPVFMFEFMNESTRCQRVYPCWKQNVNVPEINSLKSIADLIETP